MTTPAIIDAVAHAIYAAVWLSPKPWQDITEVSREVWRKAAVAAFDAAKPKRKRGHYK